MPADPTDGSRLPTPVRDWLERVDERWRSSGVDVSMRSRMGADLVEDVQTSLNGGATPEEIVADDAEQFADRLATAYDAPATPATAPKPAPASARGVVGTGLVGGAVGGLLVWVMLIPLLGSLLTTSGPVSSEQNTAVAVLLYLVCGLALIGSVLGAIRLRYPEEPRLGRTLRFVAVGVLVSGLLAIAPAAGLAWATGYSTSALGVALVGLLVLAFVAAGIRVGHWAATRTA